MKILSIDIGIKNLAYCLVEVDDGMFRIVKWEVINLCKEVPFCQHIIKNKKTTKPCGKKASFTRNNIYYCKTHAKKMQCLLPGPATNLKKSTTIGKLKELANNYNIVIDDGEKKNEIFNKISHHINNNIYLPVEKIAANDMSLVEIGIAIAKNLPLHFNLEKDPIDKIIIENQISPLANRMKTIQGMVSQYFIMNNTVDIHFISAINKLKPFTKDKLSYKERKQAGIEITRKLLDGQNKVEDWIDIFEKHKKKDDLADSLLQAIWFLSDKKYITCNLCQ
tara:strand:+ start:3174 stop:4010 length:837 start_codon:yes stop_codon:yes gene_type:complete